ncbi:MAG TPA: cupin domain-containing protein [Anaerolineae bacterium]
MSQVIHDSTLEWLPVRPEVTHDIFGRTLLAEGVKVVLTRVAPGGEFKIHRDTYGHLFYFLSGEGTLNVNDQEYKVKPGLVARILPGEPHSYACSGSQDLLLISLNLPDQAAP